MAGGHERPLLHEKPWFHGPVRAIEREVHDGIGVLERAACIRVGLRHSHQCVANRFHCGSSILSAPFDEVGQGARAQRAIEQFGEGFTQALLGICF